MKQTGNINMILSAKLSPVVSAATVLRVIELKLVLV